MVRESKLVIALLVILTASSLSACQTTEDREVISQDPNLAASTSKNIKVYESPT